LEKKAVQKKIFSVLQDMQLLYTPSLNRVLAARKVVTKPKFEYNETCLKRNLGRTQTCL